MVKFNVLPILLADYYKIGHPFQYPKNTRVVYSNLTPRKSRLVGVDGMVFFGLQYFIKEYLIDYFQANFFDKPIDEILNQYRRRIRTSLGAELPNYDHITSLHGLGYLPLDIKALPEGARVKMRVPVLTITNTIDEHYWLPNFLETILSCTVWQPCTSATIAFEYRKILNHYAKLTGMPQEFVQWQGHDFSFRGMSSLESAITSSMGHLLFFTGTDTIPAIDALEYYYGADADKELIGGSVNATEHSVMCAGAKESEIDTFKRLILEVYPKGIVSIVSDTWDLWKVSTEYMQQLKDIIITRDGKVVLRPDSGDPVDIICGLDIPEVEEFAEGMAYKYFEIDGKTYETDRVRYDAMVREFGEHIYDLDFKTFAHEIELPESPRKGLIELLWETFGGSYTSTGYKLLDQHIGAIYGDSITRERATAICERLMRKGFASQVVFGIGSYTYQYNTRDTFGTAMKATFVQIEDEGREIWKDPITDDGTKKSATGLLRVDLVDGEYVLRDKVTREEEQGGELKTVYRDGKLLVDHTLAEIRERAHALARV